MKKLTKDDLANLDQYAAEKMYSQTGEAGILRHLFACLDLDHNGFLVDIGAGDGWNLSNTRGLLNAGWGGLLIDGNGTHLGVAGEFVNDENVNAILDKYGVPAEFDLLSLDIDGQDWWVWRALNRRPRVVVVEVNSNLLAQPARTIPRYAPFVHDGTSYFGANFGAFVQLGAVKGYTLIHNRGNLNLFFVRNDMLERGFPLSVPFQQSIGQPPDTLNREWHYVTPDDLIACARDLSKPHGEIDGPLKVFVTLDELLGSEPTEAELRARMPEAFARGEVAKQELLAAEGGCLTFDELNTKHPGSLPWLRIEGKVMNVQASPGVFVYPVWQFDAATGAPLDGLERVLAILPDDDWVRMIFFLEPHPALADPSLPGLPPLRPLDALRVGLLQDVVNAALAWGAP